MQAAALPATTPMMAQWHECKKNTYNSILLFRMGDFYEAFYEDAKTISKVLQLALTQRQGIPMAGVPFHSCESYIDKLIAHGFRVAIAEQIEDPKQAKGLVKRKVVRTVSPGTLISSSLLSSKSNNYFASICQIGHIFAIATLDMSTSEFYVIELDSHKDLVNELYRIKPSELLVSTKFAEKNAPFLEEWKLCRPCLVNVVEPWHFDHHHCSDILINHFKVPSLDGFGLKGMTAGINAAGAILTYIQQQLHLPVQGIKTITNRHMQGFMGVDRISAKNLELTESMQDQSRNDTLLHVLDYTHTPMGGRLLERWIKSPLYDLNLINERLNLVDILVKDPEKLAQFVEILSHIKDLERLIIKVNTHYASFRDALTLAYSLKQIPILKKLLNSISTIKSQKLTLDLIDLTSLSEIIISELVETPPLRFSDAPVFREHIHSELDELRSFNQNSKQWLQKYQENLRESLDIKTLKVSYNRIFGYYIEVSKMQASKMPDTFIRKQTLANSERFTSVELKEYEHKIMSAEEKIIEIEQKLWETLKEKIAAETLSVQTSAGAIAEIDCFVSLANCAIDNKYCRPKITEEDKLVICQGRHPVIEKKLLETQFVPNDIALDKTQRLLIITGPNMAGKSTYIRQVALITIMAHIGSFVPATAAEIGLVDKIFTRIGASDDLSRGQSTFMVEMTETANILNNATEKSLIILDEIGRGTSTYDGISIAWAIAEFLLKEPSKKAKTLFATHYWELTELAEIYPEAANFRVDIQESEGEVIFLHKIVPGDTDKSYGIHVAKLAGLPPQVLEAAKKVLAHLEKKCSIPKKAIKRKISSTHIQMSLFDSSSPPIDPTFLDNIANINIEEKTPLEAFDLLRKLKQQAKEIVNHLTLIDN